MKLLFLSTVYPTPWEPAKGPANRSTVESLRALGCEVEVIAPVPWPERLHGRRGPAPPAEFPTYWFTPNLFRRYYHRQLFRSLRSTLQAVGRRFRPDAVLSFWAHPDGTAALQYGRSLGVPTGIIVGGSDVMLLPNKPARRHRVARTLQGADHVFAVGSELQRRVVALGVPPERVSNFYCGVDLSAFAPGDRAAARARLGIRPEARLVLWIGAMRHVKAPERVLEAARRLAPTVPELQVAMIGEGELRAALAGAVAGDPLLRERVIFPGSVDHTLLPTWYQAADLLVLPSRSEGVPNVLLEAMSVGVPFVASAVGSIPDLLPFGPSAAPAEGDVAAIAAAIAESLAVWPRTPLEPVRYDRLDGARHLIAHLQRRTA